MNKSIVLQQPSSQATELVLLFHGVGATPADMSAAGLRAALTLPDAMVVSVAAPYPSDFGRGLQWFPVQGVTEENRSTRIAQALPAFVESIQSWQQQAGIDAARTTLIGFSQGAIMSLAATQLATPPAHRVLAIAGRLAGPIDKLQADIRVHLWKPHPACDKCVQASRSIPLTDSVIASTNGCWRACPNDC
ncbi:MAG: phospholipase [Burkholderiales bacterium]|nr:phospholipase [Burkholderiales bacterium]